VIGQKGLETERRMSPRHEQGRWEGLLMVMILLGVLAACRDKEAPPPVEQSVATVNGERIGVQEFVKRLAEAATLVKSEKPLTVEQTTSLKEEVLDRLIEERLILQRARELMLTITEEDVEARIGGIKQDYSDDSFSALFGADKVSYPAWRSALKKRMLLEKVIALDVNAKITVTDKDAELYFKANRKLYASERRIHAAQIVVRDRERAEVILKRLKAGEDFDKVAREVSIGPEAARGGDLGSFERGVMPEAIDRIVFSLPVGKASGVVQSPYGFHIFKVLGKEESGGQNFAQVKERVIADLRTLKDAEAFSHWSDGLRAKAAILVNRPLPDAPASAGKMADSGQQSMTGAGE
jgi:parvulin-like peptidyl-prolyl isomerase